MIYTPKAIIEMLVPYVGLNARYNTCYGEERDEILTLEKLIHIANDQESTIRPYLKPLSGSLFGVMAETLHTAYEETKHLPYDEIQVVRKFSKTVSLLRWLGFDCDGLIEKNIALLHPNYDISDIL